MKAHSNVNVIGNEGHFDQPESKTRLHMLPLFGDGARFRRTKNAASMPRRKHQVEPGKNLGVARSQNRIIIGCRLVLAQIYRRQRAVSVTVMLALFA